VNQDRALRELERYVGLLEYKTKPGLYQATYRGSDDDIAAQKVVAEQIWNRVIGVDPSTLATDEEKRSRSRDPRRPEKDWAIRKMCLNSRRRLAAIAMTRRPVTGAPAV
jgi:hypothetical protein